MCVDIITNENIVGKSYIGPYLKEYLPSIASSIRVLINKYKDNFIEPYTFYQQGMQSLSLLGFKGIALYGLSAAIDIALWDAFAKKLKKPFAKLFGGSIINPIKSYNSRGLWLIENEKIALKKQKV